MTNEKAPAKRDILESIIRAFEGEEWKYPAQVYVDFFNKELGHLNKKRDAARVLAVKKHEEGDALAQKVFEQLTNQYESARDIAKRVLDENGEPYSWQKVQHRLGQLVKEGRAVQTDLMVGGEDGKRPHFILGYRIAQPVYYG